MQNFREKYAYRVSLHLLIAIPFFIFIDTSPGQLVSVFICFLFLASFFLRFYSLDTYKRYLDFICFFTILLLYYCLSITGDAVCGGVVTVASFTFSPPSETYSPYNFCETLEDLSGVFGKLPILLTLFSSSWLLISDVKRKRELVVTQ